MGLLGVIGSDGCGWGLVRMVGWAWRVCMMGPDGHNCRASIVGGPVAVAQPVKVLLSVPLGLLGLVRDSLNWLDACDGRVALNCRVLAGVVRSVTLSPGRNRAAYIFHQTMGCRIRGNMA